MSDLSIKAEGLGKQYVVGGAEQQYDSFREMLTGALSSPFRKYKTLSGSVAKENRFWALRDIDFEIKQGDVVGVIGRNGAGKSTLLKVLSRITSPTQGRVEIHGRVASLLEVGTGFHSELTGRENIYLNGSILGMRRAQIDRKFDEIVEFANVTKFLDTPVKRYSSGMYVRLAFSVAAHLETDVLMVDEVLAVGDEAFQKKCLGKLGDVSSKGRTVIFVSHNISAVSSSCEKGLLLDQGRVIANGGISQVLSEYERIVHNGINHKVLNQSNPVALESLELDRTELLGGSEFQPGGKCRIRIKLNCLNAIDGITMNIGIYNESEQRLALLSSENSFESVNIEEGINYFSCEINALPIVCGRYFINFAILSDGELLEVVARATTFTLRNEDNSFSTRNVNGPIAVNYDWKKL